MVKEATLGSLAPGDAAVVARVTCDRPLAVRLMEMGLCPGTRVSVQRVAPLGDPMQVSLSGYALSIRRSEALGIDVRDVERAAPATAVSHESVAPSLTSVRVR